MVGKIGSIKEEGIVFNEPYVVNGKPGFNYIFPNIEDKVINTVLRGGDVVGVFGQHAEHYSMYMAKENDNTSQLYVTANKDSKTLAKENRFSYLYLKFFEQPETVEEIILGVKEFKRIKPFTEVVYINYLYVPTHKEDYVTRLKELAEELSILLVIILDNDKPEGIESFSYMLETPYLYRPLKPISFI